MHVELSYFPTAGGSQQAYNMQKMITDLRIGDDARESRGVLLRLAE